MEKSKPNEVKPCKTFELTPSFYWKNTGPNRISDEWQNVLKGMAEETVWHIEDRAEWNELGWLEKTFYFIEICRALKRILDLSASTRSRPPVAWCSKNWRR